VYFVIITIWITNKLFFKMKLDSQKLKMMNGRLRFVFLLLVIL